MLRSLDRSTGRCPSVGGAIAGSVVGLASGVAMAALVATLDGGECGEGPCGAATLVLGASTGMLLGTLMGYERGSVRWMPVRLR